PARVLLSRALLAYSDPIRQSHGHAATSRPGRLYAAPSLCGSASATRGTFPTFAAVLSTRSVDHTQVGPRRRPVARAHPGDRLPRFVPESPPTRARLCQQYPAGSTSRRGIVRFMLRPVCLPRPPDWLRPDGVTCAPPGVLRSSVTPAWRAARYRPALGVRLNGRTGNLPLSGLAPDQSRAVSEAAQHRSYHRQTGAASCSVCTRWQAGFRFWKDPSEFWDSGEKHVVGRCATSSTAADLRLRLVRANATLSRASAPRNRAPAFCCRETVAEPYRFDPCLGSVLSESRTPELKKISGKARTRWKRWSRVVFAQGMP